MLHEQVEQGRASAVLVHFDELARPAAAHLRDDRQPHQQHDQPRRSRPARSPRPPQIPAREEISKKELAALNIERDTFHGDWNYVIRPRKSPTLTQ
jgi:hypothetical protein